MSEQDPGPIEERYAALDWLFPHAEELGVDRTRITVMGGSAGGGLAAALTLLARGRAEHKLQAQLLIYPMLDPRPEHPRHQSTTPRLGSLSGHGRRTGLAGSNCGPIKASHLNRWHITRPALAADLSGLPETFITVGALDLLLEESVAYALRLTRAAVPVEAHIYPGAPHGFRLMGGRLGEQLALDLARAFDRFLAVPP